MIGQGAGWENPAFQNPAVNLAPTIPMKKQKVDAVEEIQRRQPQTTTYLDPASSKCELFYSLNRIGNQ